ncbi:hypothetical protein B0H11DRAFT_408260 [Mycena galericulata]|nr:hypothetical protein B0H11DRAFT_408260 [Mycena galericulata]
MRLPDIIFPSMSVRLVPSSSALSGLNALAALPPKTRTPTDYKVLFRALARRKFVDAYQPDRTPAAVALKQAAPPRQLFAEMLATCLPRPIDHVDPKLSKTQEQPKLSRAQRAEARTLLVTALLAFVRTEDYAAALVALRTFSTLKLPITMRTRTAVLHPLAVRVGDAHDAAFSRTLLGEGPAYSDWMEWREKWAPKTKEGDLTDLEWRNRATGSAMKRLLAANTPPKVAADRNGADSVRPLECALRRAFRIHGGLTRTKTVEPWSDNARRRAVLKAKWEMTPVAQRQEGHEVKGEEGNENLPQIDPAA